MHLRDGTPLSRRFTIREKARAKIGFERPKPKVDPDAEGGAGKAPSPCAPGTSLRADGCYVVTGNYLWQVALVDALAVGTLTYAAADRDETTGSVGLAMIGLGGPIVHWAHGRVGRGFASMGLHLGGFLGAFGLAVGADEMHWFDVRVTKGNVHYWVAASGLFAFGLELALSHDVERRVSQPAVARWTPRLGVQPTRGGATAVLQMAF